MPIAPTTNAASSDTHNAMVTSRSLLTVRRMTAYTKRNFHITAAYVRSSMSIARPRATMKMIGTTELASANHTNERLTGSSTRPMLSPGRSRTAARTHKTPTRKQTKASLTRICGTSLPRSIPTTKGVTPTMR